MLLIQENLLWVDDLFLDITKPPKSLKRPFRHSVIFTIVPGGEMAENTFKCGIICINNEIYADLSLQNANKCMTSMLINSLG